MCLVQYHGVSCFHIIYKYILLYQESKLRQCDLKVFRVLFKKCSILFVRVKFTEWNQLNELKWVIYNHCWWMTIDGKNNKRPIFNEFLVWFDELNGKKVLAKVIFNISTCVCLSIGSTANEWSSWICFKLFVRFHLAKVYKQLVVLHLYVIYIRSTYQIQ